MSANCITTPKESKAEMCYYAKAGYVIVGGHLLTYVEVFNLAYSRCSQQHIIDTYLTYDFNRSEL